MATLQHVQDCDETWPITVPDNDGSIFLAETNGMEALKRGGATTRASTTRTWTGT